MHRWHPDKNQNNIDKANEMMRLINEANAVLKKHARKVPGNVKPNNGANKPNKPNPARPTKPFATQTPNGIRFARPPFKPALNLKPVLPIKPIMLAPRYAPLKPIANGKPMLPIKPIMLANTIAKQK